MIPPSLVIFFSELDGSLGDSNWAGMDDSLLSTGRVSSPKGSLRNEDSRRTVPGTSSVDLSFKIPKVHLGMLVVAGPVAGEEEEPSVCEVGPVSKWRCRSCCRPRGRSGMG